MQKTRECLFINNVIYKLFVYKSHRHTHTHTHTHTYIYTHTHTHTHIYIYIYIYIEGILQSSKSGVGNSFVRTNKLIKFRILKYSG